MRTAVICILVATSAIGCGHRERHGFKKPATMVATSRVRIFSDPENGFAVHYPSDWTPRQDPENVLTIDARADDATGPEISVAVPRLGMHVPRSEEHTSELQSHHDLVCRLLLE